MADDLSTYPKRRVYSDGTDGTVATPLPVMAQQDLANASAIPTSSAVGAVQPGATLATANPVAPPVTPVAAPAAAAAAAAPVTPQGGASQIPGATPYAQTQAAEAARYAALTPAGKVSESLNNAGSAALGFIGHNAQAIPLLGPEINAGLRGITGFANASRRVPGQPLATVDSALALESRGPGAVAAAKPVAPGTPAPGSVPATVQTPNTLPAVPGTQPAVIPGTPAAAAQEAQAAAAAARQGSAGPQGMQGTSADIARNLNSAAPAASSPASTAAKVAAATVGLGGAAGTAAYLYGAPSDTPATPGAPNNATTSVDTSYAQPANSAIPGAGGAGGGGTLNDVTRVGNSYSGGPNITGGITVNGAAPGGQGVGLGGTAPTPEEAAAAHARNLASYAGESQAIADRTARTLAQDEWNGPTPGMVAMDAGRTGGDAYDKFREDANLNTARQTTGWTARGGNIVNKDTLKAATDVIENRAKKEAENQRQGNDLAKTRLTTAAENARAAATNAITMRGQNITADTARENNRSTTLASIYGADSKSASERAKLEYQAKKDDKEYQRTLAKDGSEKAEKEWKSRNDAQDEITKRAQSMRDPADKAGAAKDAQAVMTHIEDVKAQLTEIVKNNPNNKEAANQLDMFNRFGARNLDDKQINDLIKGNQLAEKVNKDIARGSGLVPAVLMRMWKGTNTGVTSDEPFTGVKKIVRGGPLPDIYVETDKSGNILGKDRKPLPKGSTDYGRVLPASVVEQDEGLWGTGIAARPQNNFRTLVH